MDDIEVWAAVDQRRRAIVELLRSLDAGEWNTPSLCPGWTVRDVAAHLTMPVLTMRQIVALIERSAGHHRAFFGLTCRESLIDAIGHTFDMAIPLGREIHFPAAVVAEAADRVVSYHGRGNAKVFRSLPWASFRLTATDHDWSAGDGPPVTGTMTDLFLLLTGRDARIDGLLGPGADDLRRAAAACRPGVRR
ncbi:maleylpyruvate isomerase family mycothiol-dependent enzyme [Actinoplanes sp. TRM 88003]|uniref:Maleylpyruvate isomerase family mycothiol-dependent enzyme n=1 Tax=Paractinoplanes aksuensis TaxID=2939490 RepID=A0ABT1DMQ1_9ACTN|nr:maleylpyruvate isomerase family mycothiol-dependent enzyme [Actinoplanes aksuensis]MCO8271783.1 maleylpyruvate isomerase family mycothiol-dependent enzyme [Actinoplanes aksuensis]